MSGIEFFEVLSAKNFEYIFYKIQKVIELVKKIIFNDCPNVL